MQEVRSIFSERFTKKLDGCLLLCSNCHRLLHNGEITYSDFEFIPEDKLKIVNEIGA